MARGDGRGRKQPGAERDGSDGATRRCNNNNWTVRRGWGIGCFLPPSAGGVHVRIASRAPPGVPIRPGEHWPRVTHTQEPCLCSSYSGLPLPFARSVRSDGANTQRRSDNETGDFGFGLRLGHIRTHGPTHPHTHTHTHTICDAQHKALLAE